MLRVCDALTQEPLDKYGIPLCSECADRLESMRKTYALKAVVPHVSENHRNPSTGYHFRSDVQE